MARNRAAGLMEIGEEGFKVVEYCYGRNTRPPPRQERQPQYGNRSQQPYSNRRTVNSVPSTEEDVIDSIEAAKRYKGVLFTEAGRKKKSFLGFGFSKDK